MTVGKTIAIIRSRLSFVRMEASIESLFTKFFIFCGSGNLTTTSSKPVFKITSGISTCAKISVHIYKNWLVVLSTWISILEMMSPW